ncbi:hypothetical protein N7457_004801 [Penicillium paradoxum]|uniref:uncharacterized protein n=1 Tax=Penicillium paradoxum TaxID=176176 RepID=UPI00254698C5|nr:uncharacterized protein N7457_004801 [Penicillium paradoxum]KAJ5783027.1 hypothetical protein N7457_004801 [Penicillium paradoxum]
MHKLDDSFELSRDEEIQSLTGSFQSYQADSDEKFTAISWILNSACERARVVKSANGNPNARVLVPDNGPPFDQVRKLYFEKQNADSCTEIITTAEAYFRDQAIVGIVFVYSSGRTASTGELDTNTRQTVHFALGVRIVGLMIVIATSEDKLMEIVLEIEQTGQPQYEKLRLSINPPDGLSGPVEYGWREFWCKDDASAEDYQPRLMNDRVYKPPSRSRLVGMYMRCQEFHRIGAVYEPEIGS